MDVLQYSTGDKSKRLTPDAEARGPAGIPGQDLHEPRRDSPGQLHGSWEHRRCLPEYRTEFVGIELIRNITRLQKERIEQHVENIFEYSGQVQNYINGKRF